MTMGSALHTPSPYATCTRQDVSTAFPPRLPAHSPVSFGGYRRCRVATLPPSKHRLQQPGNSQSISSIQLATKQGLSNKGTPRSH